VGLWQSVFGRTTVDGITMRVYLEATGGLVTAELSTDAAVGIADDGFAAVPSEGIGSVSTGGFRVEEKSPVQWVIAQVGYDATVRVRFADGGTDQMKPVQGLPYSRAEAALRTRSLEVLDGNGDVKQTLPITISTCADSSCTSTTVPATGVTVPPVKTLPAPGEQPADVPTARAAVTQAYAGAYDGSASNDERARAIEGGSALVSVFDELRHGPVASSVLEAKTVVDDIVFVAPTRAAVKFHSQLGASGGTSGPYFGDAILTSSGWADTRTTPTVRPSFPPAFNARRNAKSRGLPSSVVGW